MTHKAATKRDHDVPARQLSDVPFAQVLTSEFNEVEGLRKSERTRMRITAAAAEVLEDQGFHSLRVGDVCKLAGVSQGTFYLYFENKAEVTRAVLKDFNERGLRLLSEVGPRATPWRAISATTLTITRLYSHNPGLMRSLWQIDDETPEFGEILRDANAAWIRTIARSITRRCGVTEQDAGNALFIAYALGAMVDQFLISLYVTRDPHVAELALDEEQAAELLSVLWYRAAFCADPPAQDLNHASSLENFHLIDRFSQK